MAAEKLKRASTSFGEFLSDLDNGEVERIATEKLRAVVKAVIDTNKKGKVTIVIDVESERGSMVLVSGKVEAKLPTRATMSTPLYTDESGNLALYDLKQEALAFAKPTPAKEGAGN